MLKPGASDGSDRSVGQPVHDFRIGGCFETTTFRFGARAARMVVTFVAVIDCKTTLQPSHRCGTLQSGRRPAKQSTHHLGLGHQATPSSILSFLQHHMPNISRGYPPRAALVHCIVRLSLNFELKCTYLHSHTGPEGRPVTIDCWKCHSPTADLLQEGLDCPALQSTTTHATA